jgi:hypothetical protein
MYYYKMPKKQITERPCKECNKVIEYKPRRIYCIDCYKFKNPLNTPKEVFFINDFISF